MRVARWVAGGIGTMLKHYLNFPRTVYVLCLGMFVNRVGTLLIPFLTLYLDEERGLGPAAATLAIGAYGLGAIFAAPLGGHLADRIGRRPVMVGSLLGGAVVLVVLSTLIAPKAIFLGVAVFALVGETYRPAANAMIADLVPASRRPHAYGLMYVAINLGFSIAAVIGGILVLYDYRLLFWVDALTGAAYALVILLAVGETLPKFGGVADSGGTGEEQIGALAAFREISRDRTFVIFCAGMLMLSLVFIQTLSTFPLDLVNRCGIKPDRYGRIIAVNGVLIVLFQLPITSVMRRINRGSAMIVAAVLFGLGFGAIGLAETPFQFGLTVVVWTCGEMIQAAFISTIVTDLAPVRLRGRYLGVMSMCFSSSAMVGAPIGGMVLEHLGGAVLWGSCLVVGLLAAVLFGGLRSRLTARQAESEPEMSMGAEGESGGPF